MKVLLALRDLYKNIGGGQTVYKKIVESAPHIDFYYFLDREAVDARRPANARPISLLAPRNLRLLTPPPHPNHIVNALQEADQLARSIAGESFDIVDIPDFFTFGALLKSAFVHHRVTVRRVVVAMHGNISVSVDLNWGSTGDKVLEMRSLERDQFDVADGVYSISQRYMCEWRAIVDREIYYIDPANFVAVEAPVDFSSWNERPSLYCIGRSERRKGNDLFIELVRCLNRESFDRASHIGDRDFSHDGIDSAYILENIAKSRGIDVEYRESYDYSQLSILFGKPSVVVLPVRYDSLNLVALEALFSGCPVAVSTKAGVCDYLDSTYPDVPYVKLDLDNFYDAVAKLQDLVDNYGEHRQRLQNSLSMRPSEPAIPLDIGSVYERILAAPPRETVSWAMRALPYTEWGVSVKDRLVHFARPLHPRRQYRALQRLMRAPRDFLIEQIKASSYLGDVKFFAALSDSRFLRERLLNVGTRSERNMDALRSKLGTIYYYASSPLYRCNFWLDIARIERLLDNDLMAVTYELRVLRLLGRDSLGLLPKIVRTLNMHNYVYEAKAAEALYSNSSSAEESVYTYIKESYKRNQEYIERSFEFVDDHRRSDARVSVIVSLYKAADKLKLFLSALSQQTLVRRGCVEVILIDSGSPTAERVVVDAFLKESPLSLVYARSRQRETIQAAWNRGIGLARAPYLVFLGVDETLYPEALEVLANELDHNPDVDWVMANSLVTAVDETGLYKNDIMPYDRRGATKDHVYLETCYLSWVGGMYRANLHERFGFYDESFRAGGDTEFKNRVLPRINVKFVNEMLGVFLNYPDGQTTVSTTAEIEDLRGWYLHRTPGGIRYAFENRNSEEAERLLHASLGYRKSYCGHMSCDIEYAYYLSQYVNARSSAASTVKDVESDLKEMLLQLRGLELAERLPSRVQSIGALVAAWRTAARSQRRHREALASIAWPCYSVLNDNRYEQHSWLWKSV